MHSLSNEDKKKIAYTKCANSKSYVKDVIKSIFYTIVILPIWLGILLPLTILYVIVQKFGSKKPRSKTQQAEEIVEPAKNIQPKNSRQFDLVVYGATGFTGSLVTKYLLENYGPSNQKEKLSWAIAGRSKERMEKTLKDCAQKANVTNPEQFKYILEAQNDQQLEQIIGNTRVLITTVGPYAKYGSNVVKFCAQHGTDYVDITGEVSWVRSHMSFEELQKQNEQLQKIEFFDQLSMNPSGGTLATLINSFDKSQKPRTTLSYDPLLKKIGVNQKIESKMKSVIQRWLGYNNYMKKFVGNWMLADGNSCIIKRSNALAGYGDMIYKEQLVYDNFWAGLNAQYSTIFQGTLLYNAWLRKLVIGVIIPKPGQGPSLKEQEDGFMILQAKVTGNKGTQFMSEFTLPYEPGYKDTSRMVSETALCFVFNSNEIEKQGGFWTPATCHKKTLLNRLLNTGSSFSCKSLKK